MLLNINFLFLTDEYDGSFPPQTKTVVVPVPVPVNGGIPLIFIPIFCSPACSLTLFQPAGKGGGGGRVESSSPRDFSMAIALNVN